MESESAVNFKGKAAISRIVLVLLFAIAAFQPAFAVTNYVFFSVNGDTSRTSMVQGDNVSWGSNCDVGAMLTWEIWIDLNANSVIDPLSDKMIISFDIADGESSPDGPPPDINPTPDGWYISQPMILGTAQACYIFRARNHVDNSTAQRALNCTALPSPPNMFRGRVTIAGHPAPDSVWLRNIWIEASPEGSNQMWSGLTDANGRFQINVGAVGSGLEFYIEPNAIPGFIAPGEQIRVASGVIDSVNFSYFAPSDSLYGEIRDGVGALITIPVDGYCDPQFPGAGHKDFTSVDGAYRIYFGGSEYGHWNVGLGGENLVPNYLFPMSFDLDNSVVHSQRHDFVCYNANAVIYARVTELGGLPSHQYMIQAQSTTLQSMTCAVSGTGGSNIVALHISSLDQNNWIVGVADWHEDYPIPPGYVLDGNDTYWGRHPGDTVSLNFVYGRMVRDTLRLDQGDTPVNWDNVWVNLFGDQGSHSGWADGNGIYTIYGDTGTYMLNINCENYLAAPNARNLHLVHDTTGGLGFMLNETHCRVSGTLVNVPLPIPGPVDIFAHTGTGNDGYMAWDAVDSVSGAFTLWLCDGNWTIDPPSIPNMSAPSPANLSVGERPDTTRTVNLVYTMMGANDRDGSLPGAVSLRQNYPNPFNAQTVIEYDLSQAADVKVEIYDISGRKVETLVSGNQDAGSYRVTWDAGEASSGIYLYRVQAGEAVQARKMVLMK